MFRLIPSTNFRCNLALSEHELHMLYYAYQITNKKKWKLTCYNFFCRWRSISFILMWVLKLTFVSHNRDTLVRPKMMWIKKNCVPLCLFAMYCMTTMQSLWIQWKRTALCAMNERPPAALLNKVLSSLLKCLSTS